MALTPDDFHNMTEIQLTQLDEEIRMQSQRLSEICRAHVRAKSRLARDERQLKKLRGVKSSEAFAVLLAVEKEAKSGRRPTGDQVTAVVEADDEVGLKSDQVEACRLEVDEWAAAREVWNGRAHLYGDLTKLLLNGLVAPDVIKYYDERGGSMAEYDKTRSDLAAARKRRRTEKKQERAKF